MDLAAERRLALSQRTTEEAISAIASADFEDASMTANRHSLRDWHRLFGLLLTDYFTDTPFIVEVERDLSQQQLLDVVILRRQQGRIGFRLPDGLEDLAPHNLITFKSHHEALDAWTMKELVGHSVAYRKLISPSPSQLLSESHFKLFAICARFPLKLSGQVPWQKRQDGVYNCTWGTDTIRVIVAGDLPRDSQNAPLHLFSASPELVGFGQNVYRRHSEYTSIVLEQLSEKFRNEGYSMSYTLEDFKRDYIKEHFPELTAKEHQEMLQQLPAKQRQEMLQQLPAKQRQEMLRNLPPEERLAGLSKEQIQSYLDHLAADHPLKPRSARRKK